MNILVIGSGGREHAVIKAIKKNPTVETIYCLPGNGGIAADAICVNIGAKDIDGIVKFAAENKIDYAIVTPDDPLVLGCVDALNAIGIPCCLATGTPIRRAKKVLERLGVVHLIQHFVSSSDEGTDKHFPDIYLMAIEKAGADPSRAVVFEDTGYSMKAAKDANLYLVGIRQPTTNFGPEYTDLCDLFLDDLSQLPDNFWN